MNGHSWVFYGALSDVEYHITVTDTDTGIVKTYDNPSGTLGSFADTSAFADSLGSPAAEALLVETPRRRSTFGRPPSSTRCTRP